MSRDCKVEVQRILHQRALDVKLDPELQKRCIVDLGKWCSEKPDAGQVRPLTLTCSTAALNLSGRPLLFSGAAPAAGAKPAILDS